MHRPRDPQRAVFQLFHRPNLLGRQCEVLHQRSLVGSDINAGPVRITRPSLYRRTTTEEHTEEEIHAQCTVAAHFLDTRCEKRRPDGLPWG